MRPRKVKGQMNEEKDREDSHGMVPPPPPPGERIEELFLQQNPPVFHGIGDPIEAENWVHALERTFDLLRCTDRERMTCMPFQLAGPADFWWEERKKTMTPTQRENLTWEQFKVLIYDKYIDTSYHKRKQTDRYHLEQGQKPVMGCNRAHCDISKYTPDQVSTKEEMVEKFSANLRHVGEDFCAGLKHGIMMTLASNRGLTYPDSLDRARNMETTMVEKRPTPIATPTPPQDQSRNLKGKRKWAGGQNPQEHKRQWQTPIPSQGIEQPIALSQDKSYKQRLTPCPKCNKEHGGICMAGTDICFVCSKSGHFARECPNKPLGAWARPKQAVQLPQLRAKQAQPQLNVTPTLSLQQHKFLEERKWDGDQAPSEHKKQQTAQDHPQIYGRQAAPNQIGEFRPKAPPCVNCSKAHNGECKAGTDKCYNCGEIGHFFRGCPYKNAGMGARQNSQGPRPQLQAHQAEPRGNPTPPFPPQQQWQSLIQRAGVYALRQEQPEGGPV